MGKSKRFRKGEDEFEDEYFITKPKSEKPKETIVTPQPKKEETKVGKNVTLKGTVVFGYKSEDGQTKWFDEDQTRTAGEQRFLDTGKDLIRLYMKGVRLETGYVVSWKNAVNETTK